MNQNASRPTGHYHGTSWRERQSHSSILPGLMAGLLAVGAAGYYFAAEMRKPAESQPDPAPMLRAESAAPEEIPLPTEPEPMTYYPVGLFLEDPNRYYEDEAMELFVPKMDLLCGIYGATDEDTMLQGPGLFEFAQLPGPMEQNANVSIAGNRDIGNSEFSQIDRLAPGDPLYLSYGDVLYTYECSESFVTDQFNWEPLRVQEYPCITLQSPTPPGEPRETQGRIFVVGKLVAVEEGGVFPEE